MTSPLWHLSQVVVASRETTPRLVIERLEIQAGITVLLGSSGAGKTTLIELLVGITTPSSGCIQCATPSTAGLPLFWVPQDGGLWHGICARQHLTLAAGRPTPDTTVDALLAQLDLSEQASSTPDQLSRGQRARLALARALAANPSTLVLDEPFAHLDRRLAQQAWSVLMDWRLQRQASLVIATHDPQPWFGTVADVVIVEQGRVVHAGALDALVLTPPTEAIAWLTGIVNWMEAESSSPWFDRSPPACIRPTRLQAIADERGTLLVQASHATPAGSWTLLSAAASERWFCHAGPPLPIGTKVRLLWE